VEFRAPRFGLCRGGEASFAANCHSLEPGHFAYGAIDLVLLVQLRPQQVLVTRQHRVHTPFRNQHMPSARRRRHLVLDMLAQPFWVGLLDQSTEIISRREMTTWSQLMFHFCPSGLASILSLRPRRHSTGHVSAVAPQSVTHCHEASHQR
jgi:hypothetical protein